MSLTTKLDAWSKNNHYAKDCAIVYRLLQKLPPRESLEKFEDFNEDFESGRWLVDESDGVMAVVGLDTRDHSKNIKNPKDRLQALVVACQ